MAELLKALYDELENNGGGKEAESVSKFRNLYAHGGDAEELFHEAIRDTRRNAFREGMKAALDLFAEINGGGAE